MTIKLTNKKENGSHIVTMTVTGDDWTKTLDKTQKQLLENLEIKGFRKGHVPANIAEKYVTAQHVQGKASEIIIDKEYSKVLDKLQEEKIITRPAINITKISDTEFEATFTSAIYPEIKLGKTSGFSAKWEADKASKEEVQAEIDKMAAHFMTTKEISGDRKLKDGDIANIDFVGKKDGVEFDGGAGKAYDLKVGSNSFIPGFEEQIKGMKKGEEKVIELTFPENYPSKDLAGADVTFDVTLNSIKEEVELEGKELEERLKMMGFKSKEDMNEKVEFLINDQKESAANEKYFNEVVEEIIADKGTEVEIPDALIEDEKHNQLQTFEQQLSKQGMTLDQYLEMIKKTREEFVDENLKENALNRIKHGLVYTQLVEELEATPTEKDIEKELKKIADQQGFKVEELKKNVDMNSFTNALMFQNLVQKLRK